MPEIYTAQHTCFGCSFRHVLLNVTVVEHNQHVIREADWIIYLGPEGVSKGGQIVFEGTPCDLIKCNQSLTAKYIQF